jgi:hypothetical protein
VAFLKKLAGGQVLAQLAGEQPAPFAAR